MAVLDVDSPSVQSTLSILQGVISRMAANSANAKSWCVALVSAITVVVADKGVASYVWISFVPIILLFLLDSYYLGLERLARQQYNDFVRKLHAGHATVEDLFLVTLGDNRLTLRSARDATISLSIWPFYSLIILMLLLVRILIF